jgi:DNA processing protein
MHNNKKEDLLYKIALNLINGIGSQNAKTLISYLGETKQIFKTKKSELLKIPGIGEFLSNNIVKFNNLKQAEEELKFVQSKNIKVLFYTDKDFPYRLKECADSPIILFVKGEVDLDAKKVVSIVGTRNASKYGKNNCQKIIEDFKAQEHNPLIVSGFAYGIDICAHLNALKNNIPTLAVLGHGFDIIYPAYHKKYIPEILENGAFITEFLTKTKRDKSNFVKRNRIIAGLSDLTIVVESGEKGGSLITGDIANSYNRDVFAFPGRTDDNYSKGCNKLIKTNKAALLEDIRDIEYIMSWSNNKAIQTKLIIPPNLSEQEQNIYDKIKQSVSINIDVLSRELNIETSELSIILLNLELQDLIEVFPGNLYKLKNN